jgi:hypothetical protein
MSSLNSFSFDIVYKGFKVPCKCIPKYAGGLMMHFEFRSKLVSSTSYRSHFSFREEFLCSYPDIEEGYVSAAKDIIKLLVDQRVKYEPSLLNSLCQMSLF